jgi:ATP-dependent DNA ligase
MTKLHAAVYLEYTYGTSYKFYSVALLEEDDGTWGVAFNYGRIGQPRGWGFKLRGAEEVKARKKYDSILREQSDYDTKDSIPAYAAYPGVEIVGPIAVETGTVSVAGKAVAKSAGGSGIEQEQPDDGGVPRFPAQLCGERGSIEPALRDPDRYVVEEKMNGFRGLIAILPDGNFEIRNRHGVKMVKGDIRNTPNLRKALNDLVNRRPDLAEGTLLDGELVGRTWSETVKLLSGGGSDEGLRYVVFDLPWLAGVDQRQKTLRERRVAMETLANDFDWQVLILSQQLTPSRELAAQVWERGGEGLIVKDSNTAYTPGDRRKWVKIKQEFTAEGVIMGFEGGNGKYYDTTGALRISQLKAGELTFVTNLSGMTDAERRAFGPDSIGRVIEFTHNGKTVNSYLNARWSRWRDDKDPADCSWEDS